MLALQEKLRQFRRVCAACGKEKANGAIGLKSCPCHSAWYCNAACQAAHWSEHKLLCPRRASKASLLRVAGRDVNEASARLR